MSWRHSNCVPHKTGNETMNAFLFRKHLMSCSQFWDMIWSQAIDLMCARLGLFEQLYSLRNVWIFSFGFLCQPPVDRRSNKSKVIFEKWISLFSHGPDQIRVSLSAKVGLNFQSSHPHQWWRSSHFEGAIDEFRMLPQHSATHRKQWQKMTEKNRKAQPFIKAG